jgi:ApeA N-terminal domain 1
MGEVFAKFRKIYHAHRMALDLFLSQCYGTKSFVNQQFADMVHGLEGLHRGLRGGVFVDQEHYDAEILPAIVAAIPIEIDCGLKTALKKRLEFGNELSLRRRLKDLARFHDSYARPILGKPSDFADAVADLRNELAHAIATDEPDSQRMVLYFVRLHQTKLLFQLELFHQLGLGTEFLKACVPRLASARHVILNVSKAEA